MTDPSGLTFDAAGDFDELIDEALSPRLAASDPHATTTLPSNSAVALGVAVDKLVATVPESARGKGRSGQVWRGLRRCSVMLHLCQADRTSSVEFIGD